MLLLRKHHEFVPALALVVACTLSSACMAWHTASLEPRRFSAEQSPAQVRLTFREGTAVTVKHPVMVGDSLVWVYVSGGSPRDSARSAVLASNIRRVEVHGVDAARTIVLLAVVGGVVGGTIAVLHSISIAID